MSKEKLVLSLFDLSGVMVLPWWDAGYTCFVVDIQHPKGCQKKRDRLYYWGTDILTWLPPKEDYRIAFSFSPCDDSSLSGSRFFQQKGLSSLASSIALFGRGLDICEWTAAPYCLEHPRSTISTYYRSPDFIFHPHHFNHLTLNDENYVKETCLWGGNGFLFPNKLNEMNPEKGRVSNMPPSEERKNLRSRTPDGFAKAIYLANEKESE